MTPAKRSVAVALILGCLAPGCLAGYISEVFLADPGRGAPDGVELAGLAGLAAVDLVVIDAAPDRYGQVLRVVTIPVVEAVQWISATPWPDGLWSDSQAVNASRIDLDAIGEPGPLHFRDARTLLLFDRPTGLLERRNNLFGDFQQGLLGDAVLLDQLTFTLDGAAAAPDAGPAAHARPGDVIVRPTRPGGHHPGDSLLVGRPDDAGWLSLAHPAYPFTPGWQNPGRPAAHQPEPATLPALLGGLGLALVRPRRGGGHCSEPSCGLS